MKIKKVIAAIMVIVICFSTITVTSASSTPLDVNKLQKEQSLVLNPVSAIKGIINGIIGGSPLTGVIRDYPSTSGREIMRFGQTHSIKQKAVGIYRNSAGNDWYLLDDGNWIYAKDVMAVGLGGKSPISDVIKDGLKPKSTITVKYTVTVTKKLLELNKPIRREPHSDGEIKYRKGNNAKLNVVGEYWNGANNLWYLLDDGYWIYSGNVKK